MQATYPKAIAFVLEAEGNFSDDPSDSGQATMQGITWRDAAAHRGIDPLTLRTDAAQVHLVKSLTEAEIQAIYKGRYWDAVEGDALPYPLDIVMFDSAVNLGIGSAVILLRLAMGLPVTPANMRATMATVNEIGNRATFVAHKLLALRRTRYRNIAAKNPQDEKFLRGWEARVDNLEAAIKTDADNDADKGK